MTATATKRDMLFAPADKSMRDLLKHNMEGGGRAA